ncbi:hypothetical protein Tco_0892452 [Tanacetum coccineum]|uniref:Uncharacterized protein n=1 Tax=Tanacetum coccineum TaxID=301880 RepID=A0ABQ5C5Y3_9ASTR
MLAMMLVFIVKPTILNKQRKKSTQYITKSQTHAKSFLFEKMSIRGDSNGNSLKKDGKKIVMERVILLPQRLLYEHIAVQREQKDQELPCFCLFPSMFHVADFIINGCAKGYMECKSKLGTVSQCSVNVIEDVLQSFVADTEPEQLAYEDFDQIEKLDLEEMDLKCQMVMLSVRVHKFEQKARRKIDFDKKESARAKGGNDKQRYSSFKIQEIGKKEEDSKALITVDTLVDWTDHDACQDIQLITGADKKGSQYYSDKSSEVNSNDFASSDSSVKSSEPKSNDSTSCASTSSISTSESEAEIESNVGTPIQKPLMVARVSLDVIRGLQDGPRGGHPREQTRGDTSDPVEMSDERRSQPSVCLDAFVLAGVWPEKLFELDISYAIRFVGIVKKIGVGILVGFVVGKFRLVGIVVEVEIVGIVARVLEMGYSC